MATKKDYFLVAIIGVLFGLLLAPIIKNIELGIGINILTVFILAVICGIAAVIALWIAILISKKIPVILQVAKFSAVGGLNTLLDLGVINLLMAIFSIVSGPWYSVFKGISFVIANINSYFWNKYWTFGSKANASAKEFGQFFAVSVAGFVLNIGVATLIVNVIGPIGEMSGERWANIGAISATIVSLIWNFIGYKFIVFKKNKTIGETF